MDMQTLLLGNPLTDWAFAIGIALAINLVIALFKWATLKRLASATRDGVSTWKDAVVIMVQHTRQWLLLLVTLLVGTRYLDLPEKVDDVVKGVATVAFFVQLGMWGGTGIDIWTGRARRRAQQHDLGATTSFAALTFIGKLLVWAVVLLLALDNLGIDVTAMVAGLGIGGIAVALAVQNVLGDLFASLSIVVDKPFVIGDFIVVDDYAGTVEAVGLKTTRIRSLDGEQIIFSNSDLLKTRLRNFKRMQERRAVFRFGVEYDTPTATLQKIPGMLKELVEAQKLTRFDRAHFKGFGESSLDFEMVYWMMDPDFNKYMDVQQAINLALIEVFAKAGVEFAFPTRKMVIERAEEEEGGDEPARTEPRAPRPSDANAGDGDGKSRGA